jgi:hypothetical protein
MRRFGYVTPVIIAILSSILLLSCTGSTSQVIQEPDGQEILDARGHKTPGTIDAVEEILGWHSDFTVAADGSMKVTETIRVRAEGIEIKRGIYRDFPTTYRGKTGNQTTIGFDIISIMRDGHIEPYHTKGLRNGVRIYIGSKNVFLNPAVYTYTITYRTDRHLGFYEEHDELYWNVTGNGWGFPILQSSATVILPPTVPVESVKTEGYTGPQGSWEKAFTSKVDEAGRVVIECTRPLAPGEGLTIVVGWPKGHVTP